MEDNQRLARCLAETERLRGLLANSEMTVAEVIAENARLRAKLKVVLDPSVKSADKMLAQDLASGD
jgi:hypothetical protein